MAQAYGKLPDSCDGRSERAEAGWRKGCVDSSSNSGVWRSNGDDLGNGCVDLANDSDDWKSGCDDSWKNCDETGIGSDDQTIDCDD